MTASPPDSPAPSRTQKPLEQCRVLTVIAFHGTKNRRFLDEVVARWHSMPMEVDVVLLVEEEKDVPEGVEVVVGTPTDDPRSLPFAHRRVFIQRKDDYDLYVYTEDDTLVTLENLRAYHGAQSKLRGDEIVGFLRYEERPDGRRTCSSAHSFFRWLPGSAVERGGEWFAHFTNDHSACIVLTRAQLHGVVASGRYDVPPYRGRYSTMVSAVVGAYTDCGLRRLNSVSRLQDLMLHHLPNVYLDRLGMEMADFEAQADAVRRLGADAGTSLVPLEPALEGALGFDKEMDRRPPPELVSAIPGSARRVLSVGAGSGRLERELARRGHSVVAVPQDAVSSEPLRRDGITVLAPDLGAANDALRGEEPFDCVVVDDCLHRAADPAAFLRAATAHLAPGGAVVVTAPNMTVHPRRRRGPWNSAQRARIERIGDHAETGLHRPTSGAVRRWISSAELRLEDLAVHSTSGRMAGRLGALPLLPRLFGRFIVARARRPST